MEWESLAWQMTVLDYLGSFALTEAVETPLYVALLYWATRVPVRRSLPAAAVVNLITHPLFTFVLVPLVSRVTAPTVAVALGEAAVCVAESVLLFAWVRREPLLCVGASMVANGCSFGAGLIIASAAR